MRPTRVYEDEKGRIIAVVYEDGTRLRRTPTGGWENDVVIPNRIERTWSEWGTPANPSN